MQEFSSISVSSYEAGALASRLTEQSADGWSVVTIVPTGSTVTAYLSRPAGASAAPAAATEPDAATASAAMLVGDDEAAAETGDDSGSPTPDEPDVSADSAPEPEISNADSNENPVTAAPGWAASTTTEAPEAPAATPSAPVDAGAMGAAASAAGAAPAGWYADPSSRFELRYWDGTQWTEHVSRAGQQYTDPPVA